MIILQILLGGKKWLTLRRLWVIPRYGACLCDSKLKDVFNQAAFEELEKEVTESKG